MREATLTNLVHPEFVDGRQLWIEPDVAGVLHRLHYGDPTKGWEGDPRLAVYYDPRAKVWELTRYEADGQYRLVARSKPGVRFNESLIDALVARDVRRGFDPHKHIVSVNEGINRKRSAQMQEYIAEEVAPRLQAGLRKQFG